MPPMEPPMAPPSDMGAEPNALPPMGGEEELPENPVDSENAPDDGGNPDKKEIQKLVGKLTQMLTDYNDSLEEPDTETNKYVGGMIAKQVGKALTVGDKKDVIKKLNDAGNADSEGDTEIEPQPEEMSEQPDVNESLNRLVQEIAGEILDSKRQGGNEEKRLDKCYKSKSPYNPFIAKGKR